MAKGKRGPGNQGLPNRPNTLPKKTASANPQPRSSVAYKKEFSLHAGPLPPPGTIQQYDEILPGAAQTIFDNWNKEIEHRQDFQDEQLRLEAKDSARGMYCALTVMLAGMGVATYLGIHGQTVVAAAAIGAPILGVATTMILGRNRPQ